MRKTLWCWTSGALLVLFAGSLCAEEEPTPPAGTVPVAEGMASADATFRRIDLSEAVRLGLRANLQIKAGSYVPSMAVEGWRAASAIFDPIVTAGLQYAHDESPVALEFFGTEVWRDKKFQVDAGVSKLLCTGGTVSFLYQADRLDTNNLFQTVNPTWTQGAVVEGTQPLLRGAGDVVMADIRLAHNDIVIAREEQKALVEGILLEIVRAYWELVYAQELVLARMKSEDVASELLRDARARKEARLGTPLEVAEAKAGLKMRQGNRIFAEGTRSAAQDALRVLILPFSRGAASNVTLVATDTAEGTGVLATPDAAQLDHYVEMALAKRPEMRSSKAGLTSRDIEMRAAANAVRPQLDLVARFGTGGIDGCFDDSFSNAASFDAVSGAIGLRFSMFIGNGAARANLRLAAWARRQATVGLKDLENQIVAEVRAGIRDVGVAMAIQAAGAEEVKASTEDLRGEERRRANGKSTPFRVLQKEDALTDARTRQLRSGVDRRIAEASFWRAVGLLSETLGATSPGK